MIQRLFRWVDKFQGVRVLVIGEAMLDNYLMGMTNRLSPEAPVPVVAVGKNVSAAGGAANSAVNVTSLGAHAMFLSVIGDDAEGAALQQALEHQNVTTEHLVIQKGRRTLSKNRVIAGDQMLVRFDQGDTEPIDSNAERGLIHCLHELYAASDAVIVSDYQYGILTPRVIEELTVLQARSPRIVMVDSKNLLAYREVGITAVKPNYLEAIRLLEIQEVSGTADRAAQMMQYSEEILKVTGAKIAAVTLDSDGALIFETNKPVYRTYAQPTKNTRAAGAGDTFVSTFALTLATGAETPVAAELASAAAALVVQKDGTTTCSAQELRGYVVSDNKYMPDLSRLVARVQFYREQGKRIVLTNGCFDILHRGHIDYLNRAKQRGDILIVGMNTDESVRKLKGSERPINTLRDRAQVLEALSCIDHIVAFDEDTPINLVQAIRPDVFVKGGDYTRAMLPEAPFVEMHGGRIEILPYESGYSTTNLIQRIREEVVEQTPDDDKLVQANLNVVVDRNNGKAAKFVLSGSDK
ncbi:MAG: D-glycero-beta-D-manno-heptose 1-phosphate adenylyltransferase [Chloroflexi bacterium]|nr:D-glycero-beta-D-manno-heptose 1-phosphate adenylyltransferase [Chloroflexota bacterium]